MTEAQIFEIRRLAAMGMRPAEITRHVGLPWTQMRNVARLLRPEARAHSPRHECGMTTHERQRLEAILSGTAHDREMPAPVDEVIADS